MLNASHDLRTELEGNVVKFIFEDIYLPFEDATNDGYVTFRINTLADLELGHDIQNRAGIYFDFNFPIITNTTTTVVSDLTNVTDLNPGKLNISYYPNPTTRQVQITSDEPIEAVELLTLDGRVCAKYTLAQPVGSYSLPLEGLSPGVYLVSIRSGGETSTGKLVVQ